MSETYNSTAIAKADGTVEEISNNEKVLNDLDPLYAKTNELDHNLVSKVLTGTKPTTAIESGEYFKDKDGNFRVANQAISTSTDVSDSNSTIKTAGEVLRELNSNLIKFQPKTHAIGIVTLNGGVGSAAVIAFTSLPSTINPIMVRCVQYSDSNILGVSFNIIKSSTEWVIGYNNPSGKPINQYLELIYT